VGDIFGGAIGSPAIPPPPPPDPAIAANKNWWAQQSQIPGMVMPPQSTFEEQAGVQPGGYQGIVDPTTGQLLSQYTLNQFQPGSASSMLRSEAESTGPTDWAQAQTAQEQAQEKTAMGNAGLQSQTANDEAQAQLARNGGISSGARTSLARSSARDALNANQGVANTGMQARLGITANDMGLKQQLLGATAGVEQNQNSTNLSNVLQNMQGQNLFNTNRYNQQMAGWGAQQSANATRAAGASSGGKK